MKKRDLERHLTEHGCRLVREGANHEMWENPATAQRSVIPRHREIKTPTARGICNNYQSQFHPGADQHIHEFWFVAGVATS